jgi:undecaprenyl-diphosphatase
LSVDPPHPEGTHGIEAVRPPPALPRQLATPLAVVAVLAAATVVVLGIVFAQDTTGTAFDTFAQQHLWRLGSPWYQLAELIDFTAEPVGVVLVLGVLLLVLRRLGHGRAMLLLLAGTAASVVTTTALKPLVGRDINNGFLAFPSGHTATATSIALVCVLVIVQRRRLGATAGMLLAAAVVIPAAAAMAWAMVVENSHYPTDTLGGFCVALVMVPLTARVIDVVVDRRLRRTDASRA